MGYSLEDDAIMLDYYSFRVGDEGYTSDDRRYRIVALISGAERPILAVLQTTDKAGNLTETPHQFFKNGRDVKRRRGRQTVLYLSIPEIKRTILIAMFRFPLLPVVIEEPSKQRLAEMLKLPDLVALVRREIKFYPNEGMGC